MASHGDKESSRVRTTLFSNRQIAAARSSSSSCSISISSSNLSHESGRTNPASSPASAQHAQPAARTSRTQTWPAWGGTEEVSSTNEHQVAIVSPTPAAPNPQNQEAADSTNLTAPNPTAPARGTHSPRDKRHGTSGDTAAAESSSTTLIPPDMTATATATAPSPRPEEPHELASVDSVAEAATVSDNRSQPSDTEQAPMNIGEGGSTSHSNPQPSSYDSDANTLAGSIIEIESVRIIISRRPGASYRH